MSMKSLVNSSTFATSNKLKLVFIQKDAANAMAIRPIDK
jgi:hypothetical protein